MAVRTPLLNYYEVLGISRDAEPAAIEAAYKGQMLRVRDVPGSGEQTRRLNLAFRALSNPERRREYDSALSGGARNAAGASTAPPSSAAPTAVAAVADPSPAGSSVAPTEAAPPHAVRPEAAPTVHDDPYEAAPARQDRRGGLLFAAIAAGLLFLLVSLWASGLFDSDPKIAAADTAPHSASNPRPGAVPANAGGEERSGLVEALASILPSSNPSPPDPKAGEDVTETVSSVIEAARAPRQAGQAEQPAEVPSASVEEEAPTPAAEEEAPAIETPEPAQEAPPAPPQPVVDRSAGPRLVSGGLLNSDNAGGRYQGTVGVRLTVGPNGRPQGCRVRQSSGNATLDATTCRLLQDRLQFAPARDREGNPTSSEVISTHVWGRQPRR